MSVLERWSFLQLAAWYLLDITVLDATSLADKLSEEFS